MKLPGRKQVEVVEPEPSEKTRLCPECGTPVATRATTCAMCGHDFVAATHAEEVVRAEQQEEAAQRPVRAIAIGVTTAIVILLIAVLYVRNRAEAIAALTPTVTPTPTNTRTPTTAPSPTPLPPFTATPIPPREYVVQPNDTIFYIADIFEVNYLDILAYNNLTEDSILHVEQTILIPPPTFTPTPTSTPLTATPLISPTPGQIIYVVQQGDTILSIALEKGVNASVILDANNIEDPNLIKEGDRLIIPLGPAPASSAAIQTPTPPPSYGAVTLLQPLDGGRIVGNDKAVLLQWLSTGILQKDETYRITVEQISGNLRLDPIYLKATALHLPLDLFPAANDANRTFRWTIAIVRQVGVGKDGIPLYSVISPLASRTFIWAASPPTPTLTPLPSR